MFRAETRTFYILFHLNIVILTAETYWPVFLLLGLCDPECWDACPGSVYAGTLSVSINGKTCQAWSKYFPGEDSASNYCRDPQGIGQPGCYITDPVVPYEFCDVPICDCKFCIMLTRLYIYAINNNFYDCKNNKLD